MRLSDLRCRESELLNAIIRLAEWQVNDDVNLETATTTPTTSNIRNKIGDILRLIRFKSMNMQEFPDCALDGHTNIYTSEEYFEIISIFSSHSFKSSMFSNALRTIQNIGPQHF